MPKSNKTIKILAATKIKLGYHNGTTELEWHKKIEAWHQTLKTLSAETQNAVANKIKPCEAKKEGSKLDDTMSNPGIRRSIEGAWSVDNNTV